MSDATDRPTKVRIKRIDLGFSNVEVIHDLDEVFWWSVGSRENGRKYFGNSKCRHPLRRFAIKRVENYGSRWKKK